MSKKYNLINNLCGWFSFLVAAIVYLLTIEPTASFWDCGEFIASSYKLEVGHPPGNPFFMLTAKFFSLFASDPSQVAAMVNRMSALLSALTILFLFWTITHFAKKIIYSDSSKEMSLGQTIVIMGCGLIGALTYTFTDTFWFSAVEAEVYAYSSMFTALVFWLILKWENRADQPGSDKWLVLIAYTMGLSIGVHLLNLLCIPAIVLVYYFKKSKNVNLKGTLVSLIVSLLLIVVLMYGVIPGFVTVGGWFELLFVNSFGFSYNTGVIAYIILLVASILWGLYETLSSKGTLKKAKIAFVVSAFLSGAVIVSSSVILWILMLGALIAFLVINKNVDFRKLNTAILCLFVILIGYSSFAIIPIRSMANPPMDQNSPESVFALASYLNREQYGDRPLFYGKTYASSEERDATGRAIIVDEKTTYEKVIKRSPSEKDEYVEIGKIPTYQYTHSALFPRMYSNEPRHIRGYQMWAGITNPNVPPTFLQNVRYFLDYQVGNMYIRYFMWNFSGRQNDIQNMGGITNGNWITGIKFIDEHVLGLGPQDNLPPDIANNKGHNAYYALPFILGILGIVYQLRRGREGQRQFLITFMLFFMTGLAIIIYLNQKPFEPRERDYAFAGSFYAYCIWIGFGVAFIWNLLKKKLGDLPSAIIATVATLFIPIQMASQNWDDHDRSNRYTMVDFARNYLIGCEPNAILFTNGDNDTFPLWYIQDVEGYRTDVRVCNLSYLQTDWYVDQMRRQAYDSKPLPIDWRQDRYSGNNGQAAYVLSRKDIISVINEDAAKQGISPTLFGQINYAEYFDVDAYKDTMSMGAALDILKEKDNYAPKNPFRIQSGVILPSSVLTTTVDTSAVNWKGLGSTPKSTFTVNLGDNKGAIYRQEMMILDMLYNINKEGWERPIYYAVTIGDPPLNLSSQGLMEGINMRIVPGTLNESRVNTDIAFDNLVNKYKWGGINNPKVYLDENNLRMCRTFRMMFINLVSALVEEGKKEKALIALDKCVEEIPGNTVPRGSESLLIANYYYELGQKDKAEKIMREVLNRTESSLQWFASMKPKQIQSCSADIREYLDTEIRALDIYQRYDKAKYDKLLLKVKPTLQIMLSNDVIFDDRNHPLDYLMSVAIRDARESASSNPNDQKSKEELISELLGIMQKYDPNLLERYSFLFR